MQTVLAVVLGGLLSCNGTDDKPVDDTDSGDTDSTDTDTDIDQPLSTVASSITTEPRVCSAPERREDGVFDELLFEANNPDWSYFCLLYTSPSPRDS